MTLPFITAPKLGGIQPFGVSVLLGLVAAVLATGAAATRLRLMSTRAMTIAAILLPVAAISSHLFDVAIYQQDRLAETPGLWWRFWDGISLFGAIGGCALGFAVWASLSRVSAAAYADALAVGFLVAVTLGRVGCALVHDHPGVPTDSVFGVDFPAEYTSFNGFPNGARLHDVGLEELLCLVPVTLAALSFVGRLRRGMLAASIGLAYAVIRFNLDFLRLPRTEHYFAGLTSGQWGCLALAAGCVLAVVLNRHNPRPAQVVA